YALIKLLKQINVVAKPCPIPIDRGHKKLPRPERSRLPGPFPRIPAPSFPARVAVHFIPSTFRIALGVDCDHDALRTVDIRQISDKSGRRQRRGVYRYFVGSAQKHRLQVARSPNPSTDGERYVKGGRNLPYYTGQRLSLRVCFGDFEEDDFVGSSV